MREIHEAIGELLAQGQRGALATVTRTSGSTPQSPGARLLLREDGSICGTVGGGAIEAEVIRTLTECLRTGRSQILTSDLGRDLGMCCGGRMEVFIEALENEPRLIIFGAGHVAMPTAAMARLAGFRVCIVDDREELNSAERFPGCERHVYEPIEAADVLSVRSDDWLLIVTHDHHLDEAALDHYARGPHRYIGMIGSKRKVFRVLHRIASRADLPPLNRVYAPVGVPLGAVSPGEIAASIVAELVGVRHNKDVQHMRAVDDPRLQRVLNGDLTPEDAAKALPPA